MQVDLAIQAHKLETLLDHLHNEICAELGMEHRVSNMALQASARAFAIFCDLTVLREEGGSGDD